MSKNIWLGVAAATLMSTGCAEDAQPFDPWDDEASNFRAEQVARERPTGGGGFINNGLHDPQVGGLFVDCPLDNIYGLDGSKLDDPDRLATARYVVECALPADVTLVKEVGGEPVEFAGALGLAPEWESGPCDEDCQQWVSACVLARTNVSGQPVPLWLRGEHPMLGAEAHPEFPNYEASFFGNLFAGPGQEHMCIGTSTGPVFGQLEGRTCSNLVGGYCDFTSYLACEVTQRCEFSGLLQPTADGCRTGENGEGQPMHTITTYVESVL